MFNFFISSSYYFIVGWIDESKPIPRMRETFDQQVRRHQELKESVLNGTFHLIKDGGGQIAQEQQQPVAAPVPPKQHDPAEIKKIDAELKLALRVQNMLGAGLSVSFFKYQIY